MDTTDRRSMRFSRREFGKLTLAGLPASWVLGSPPLSAGAKIDSKINGVQIGAITYSFRTIPNPDDIIKAYVTIGLGEMELMSNHAEALAGAPSGRGGVPAGGQGRGAGGGRATPTPEQVAEREAAAKALHDWRMAATEATFKPVRQKIADAGIDLRLLCYNMNVRNTKDDEIEYAFMMAKWLGVKAISTSTQVSMAKRLAPFADKHKMMVGFHGHANLTDPDEVAKPESFAAVMAASKHLGANLDIGHFTEAGYDPVAFIQQNHARITNLHLKDKKKATNGGGNTPWGQGDTAIKDVLKLLQKNKWEIPANIEYEYGPANESAEQVIAEMKKCLQYAKEALA
jgi:sugar phosphate isomerase/epimerase